MTKIDEEEIAKTSDEIIKKIEKFFMMGKGISYDVHFWKNDVCLTFYCPFSFSML